MTPEEFLAGVEKRLAATDWPWTRAGDEDLAKLTTALRGVLALVDMDRWPKHLDVDAPWTDCPACWRNKVETAITDALGGER